MGVDVIAGERDRAVRIALEGDHNHVNARAVGEPSRENLRGGSGDHAEPQFSGFLARRQARVTKGPVLRGGRAIEAVSDTYKLLTGAELRV